MIGNQWRSEGFLKGGGGGGQGIDFPSPIGEGPGSESAEARRSELKINLTSTMYDVINNDLGDILSNWTIRTTRLIILLLVSNSNAKLLNRKK